MLEIHVIGYPNRTPVGYPNRISSRTPTSGLPRTYGRTYGELLTLGSYLTLGIARRGAARFSPLGDENSRPVAAARGLRPGDPHA